MNDKIQKGWWIAIVGIVLAMVIQVTLIKESYQYEKSKFVTQLNSILKETIWDMNMKTQRTSKSPDVVSVDSARKKITIRKDGIYRTFDIDKSIDINKGIIDVVTNQGTYDLRDLDLWDLARLNTFFQQRLKEAELCMPVKFVLTDTAGAEIDRYESGVIDSRNEVEVEPIYLGFIDRHVLQVNCEFPISYYWLLAAERVKVACLFFVVLLFCIFLLVRIIRRERKIRKNKEKLVHSLVHNLKNPVAASLVSIEAAEREIPPTERAGKVDEVFSALAKRMTSLKYNIDELLTADANVNGFQINLQEVDVERLTDELIRFYEPLCTGEKTVTFRVDNCLLQRYLVADYNHLYGVLSNLIANSLRYSNNEVKISITFRREGNDGVITVADTGIGISSENQKYIFEPGYRVVTNSPGYGMGLYYAYMVVAGHHGKISVWSRAGRGTKFTILLPQKRRWWNFKK